MRDMSREEMLGVYLNMLDEVNASVRSALDTLNENAKTISMVIDELMYGAAEPPEGLPMIDIPYPFEKTGDEIVLAAREGESLDSFTDRIVEAYKANGAKESQGFMLSYDPSLFVVDYFGIMDMVQSKMDKVYDEAQEEKKEDENDEYNFKDIQP